MIFLLVFVTALLLSLGLTPLAARFAIRTGAIDQPAPRRVHDKPTPRLGGLPIFVGFVVAIGISLLYPRTDPNEMTRLVGLLILTVLVFVVGAYDDYREMKPLPQLVIQIIAAAIAVASGVLIREIPNPLGGSPLPFENWFAVLFTLFWLVGTMNTVNWLDGIDGLAGGVVIIASAILFIHTFRLEQYSLALLALALAGTVLGFLPFNFYPARIFLGSAGANVLGFALGVLSIIGGAKVATALLVLGIPILDVAWQIFNRLRAHRSPFAADRGHLHHRLLDLGLSQRAIVLVYYAFTMTFGALALYLPSAMHKSVALVIIGIAAILVLAVLGQRKQPPATGGHSPPQATQ